MSASVLLIALLAGAALGLAARFAATTLARPAEPTPLPVAIAGGALMALSAVAGTRAAGGADVVLGWCLLCLFLTDVAALRLPNVLTLPLAAAGLLAAVLAGGGQALLDRGIGAAAGYLAVAGLAMAYRARRGREGLGMGDAKLAAVAGAWLGWRDLPVVVLAACALAFVWIAVRAVRDGRDGLQRPFPFGAPLAAAIWMGWLAPPALRLALEGLS
jgi:leader peptidase (prepilin peptidase)/N-methyltransferase